MRLLLLFFSLLLHLTPYSSFSQSYYFRNYNVDDGMPFAQVSAIHQGEQGYLWTGAYGGLSRFDGRTFQNYSPKDGLITHTVNSITTDNDGNVWIGTVAGVSKFNRTTFSNYTKVNGLPDNFVNVLLKDDKNRIWAGTNAGLASFDKISFVPYSGDPILQNAKILSMYVPYPGSMWVGTASGAYLINTSSLKVEKILSLKDGLCDSVITAIASTPEKNIYFGTPNGISIYAGGSVNNILAADGLPDNAITTLTSDKKGKLWVGTTIGLAKYEGNKFSHYTINGPFGSNRILSLFVDRENNLWVGTNNGLYKHSGDVFSSWSAENGLLGAFVFPIERDKNETLWIGTDDGLNYLKDGKLAVIKKKDGLSGNVVNDLEFDTEGKLFVGTNQGLSIYNGQSFRNYFGKKEGLISDSVTSILRDHTGKMWLGGNGGYSTFEKGEIKTFRLPASDRPYDVWYLFEDSKHRIWMGTFQGGLYMYDGEIHEMNKELELKDESFLAITEDKNGNIWLGSLRGIDIWDGKIIYHIDESDGLASDLVYVLGEDKDENFMWVGTNQGMNKIPIDFYKNRITTTMLHYGKEDGFIFGETNSNGFWKDKDGSIWFGTVGGVIRYNPAELFEKELEPIIHITSIGLFYKDTLFPQGIELPYDQNHLSFSFIGIHLSNPTKVMYQYRLVGYEQKWSPVTAFNVANYSSLPPGDYTFEVKSMNSHGLWNLKPEIFKFKILSPWWKTLWFQLTLIAALLLMGYAAVRFRINQVEQREKNRTRLAAMELKALRAQMNPHFIFNALNSIQHFIMYSNEEGATKYLNKFAKLIRSILNNSERSVVSLEEEVESLKLYLDLEVLRFENKFTYEIRIAPKLNLDFHEIPTMLIQPYVENAILHGLVPKKEGGKLDIELTSDENHIICNITDNGIGRKASRVLREKSMMQTHQSFGMKITHDRLELLNSVQKSNLNVSINDLEDVYGTPTGTRVEIFIPIT